MLAKFEGVDNVRDISPMSRFFAGGVGGVVSQYTHLVFNISEHQTDQK